MTSGPHGLPLVVFEEVSSTNDTLRDAAAQGAPAGMTHVALAQSQGRGRAGRSWWSPRGAGLSMSTLLRPEAAPSRWSGLALVTGVAVRRALTGLGVGGVQLEWPNDLVVGHRKLGGILCEAGGEAPASWVVLGIGVNVDLTPPSISRAIPAELRPLLTCLASAGPPVTRDVLEVARAVLSELWPLAETYLSGARLLDLVETDLAQTGRQVRVERPGCPPLEGVAIGLGELGELLVRDVDGKVERIVAGDVRYL